MEPGKETQEILRALAENAAHIKEKVLEDDLNGSAKLVGERVALVETLRQLAEAKVSIPVSDSKEEMSLLMKSVQKNVYEAVGTINARLSALSNELAKTRGAKRIAAYNVQGGRHGY